MIFLKVPVYFRQASYDGNDGLANMEGNKFKINYEKCSEELLGKQCLIVFDGTATNIHSSRRCNFEGSVLGCINQSIIVRFSGRREENQASART